MRFISFRRKPPNPHHQAVQLLAAAMVIIWQHKRTQSFLATEGDFETLRWMKLRLWHAFNEMEYVTQCLRQRATGQPEENPKWYSHETFDYHHPDWKVLPPSKNEE
jgi:hypothetical protein